jgi:hypothetical protein
METDARQSTEVWRLVDLYRAEAERCRQIGAYLAGCVMLGSALEAGLLLMAECQVDNVRASARVPKTNRGAPKPPQKWTLGELIDVGRDMTWLPSATGHVGDYASAVQKTRNLVHAGTYVTEHAGLDIGEEDYESAYTVVQAAFDWLDSRICDELARPEA